MFCFVFDLRISICKKVLIQKTWQTFFCLTCVVVVEGWVSSEKMWIIFDILSSKDYVWQSKKYWKLSFLLVWLNPCVCVCVVFFSGSIVKRSKRKNREFIKIEAWSYRRGHGRQQTWKTYSPRAKCGPWKLLIWPAIPQIMRFQHVCFIETHFERVIFLARHEFRVVQPWSGHTTNLKT